MANKLAHLAPIIIRQQQAALFNLRNNTHDLQLLSNSLFYSSGVLIAFMRAHDKSSKAALLVINILLLPAILFLTKDLINSINIPQNIGFICGIFGGAIIFYELGLRNNFSLLTTTEITASGIKFRHPALKLASLLKICFLAVAMFMFSAQHLLGIFSGMLCLALAALYCFIFIPRIRANKN